MTERVHRDPTGREKIGSEVTPEFVRGYFHIFPLGRGQLLLLLSNDLIPLLLGY